MSAGTAKDAAYLAHPVRQGKGIGIDEAELLAANLLKLMDFYLDKTASESNQRKYRKEATTRLDLHRYRREEPI